MESVAARAKTGVAVLYRRWPRKDDLVLGAIQHYGATHPVEGQTQGISKCRPHVVDIGVEPVLHPHDALAVC